jgi:hypothetical protein
MLQRGLLVDFVGWWWWILGWWHFDVRRGWVDIVLVLFLAAQDFNSVLELRKSCSFSIYVLLLGFGVLDCYLPPHDRFLFLMEPFNLLLDSEQLFIFCNFFLEIFFLPVLYLDLLDLNVSLNDLYWRGCPLREMVWATSVGLG